MVSDYSKNITLEDAEFGFRVGDEFYLTKNRGKSETGQLDHSKLEENLNKTSKLLGSPTAESNLKEILDEGNPFDLGFEEPLFGEAELVEMYENVIERTEEYIATIQESPQVALRTFQYFCNFTLGYLENTVEYHARVFLLFGQGYSTQQIDALDSGISEELYHKALQANPTITALRERAFSLMQKVKEAIKEIKK